MNTCNLAPQSDTVTMKSKPPINYLFATMDMEQNIMATELSYTSWTARKRAYRTLRDRALGRPARLPVIAGARGAIFGRIYISGTLKANIMKFSAFHFLINIRLRAKNHGKIPTGTWSGLKWVNEGKCLLVWLKKGLGYLRNCIKQDQ